MRVMINKFSISGGSGGEYAVEFSVKIESTKRSEDLKLRNACESVYTNFQVGPDANKKDIADALRVLADHLEEDANG